MSGAGGRARLRPLWVGAAALVALPFVMSAVGLTVNRLIRISYGPFQLGELTPGAVEEVRQKALREQLGLPHPAPRGPAPGPRRRKG